MTVRLGTLLLVLALAGCDSDPTGVERTQSIEITLSADSVDVGQTLQLAATARDASGSPVDVAIEWSSSDPAIVEVSGARTTATARRPGSAFLRASVGRTADSVLVTVEPRVATLAVWPADTIRILRGRAAQLFLEMTDEGGTPVSRSVRIASTDPAVALVDGTTVRGIGLGAADVTVSAGAGASRTVRVQVVSGASYRYRSLGELVPWAVNNRGWIVGALDGQAALWRAGRVERLSIEGAGTSTAFLVNDSALVVGTALPMDGSPPFLWTWRNGAARRIPLDGYPGTSPPGSLVLGGMNGKGEFVGTAFDASASGPFSFHWDGARLRWLPAGVRAFAIDEAGLIVGTHLVRGEVVTAIPKPRPDAESWVAVDLDGAGRYVGTYRLPAHTCVFFGEGERVAATDHCAASVAGMNRYGDVATSYSGMSPSAVRSWWLFREGSWLGFPSPEQNSVFTRDANDLGEVLIVDRGLAPRSWLGSPAD